MRQPVRVPSWFGGLLLGILAACPTSTFAQSGPPRNWTSQNGLVVIRATFVGFEGEQVRLRRFDGTELLTDPANLSDEDRAYLQKLRDHLPRRDDAAAEELSRGGEISVARMRAAERRLVLAKDIFDYYRQLEDSGRISADNAVFVENKLRQFQPLKSQNAIDFGNEFVPESEVPVRREKARKLVDQWLDVARKSNGDVELNLLKEATDTDPIGTVAALLEGMHYYFYSRDYEKAYRSFRDAADRGERYRVVHTPADRKNYEIALNACAVLAIRSKNAPRARSYFEEVVQNFDVQDVGIGVKSNLRRTARLARLEDVGIDVPKSQSLKFEELFRTLGIQIGGENGWIFPFPHSETGPFQSLEFLLGKNADGVALGDDGFEDFICLLCEGARQARCPNPRCVKGAIEVPTWVWVQRTETIRDRVRKNVVQRCPRCRGNANVSCWGCDASGTQHR